jgi:5-methylcytosine-specific restriction endonuclease McrA
VSIEHIRNLKALADEPKPKKQYVIPKVSKKRQKKLEDQKDIQKKDHEFYKEIWAASPHTCVECKRKLGRIPNTIYFHHLLPKRNYPQYRRVPENIGIVCPDCHQQVEVNIDKTPTLKRLTEEAEKNCHKWEVEP